VTPASATPSPAADLLAITPYLLTILALQLDFLYYMVEGC
jgi:hypothetical protein